MYRYTWFVKLWESRLFSRWAVVPFHLYISAPAGNWHSILGLSNLKQMYKNPPILENLFRIVLFCSSTCIY